ncbi:Unknown protein, partial [Striga hermonthica]
LGPRPFSSSRVDTHFCIIGVLRTLPHTSRHRASSLARSGMPCASRAPSPCASVPRASILGRTHAPAVCALLPVPSCWPSLHAPRAFLSTVRTSFPSPSPSPPRRQHQAPPAMDLAQLIVQFQRMNAPTFSGTENPTVVLEWMKELDKIFAVLPLPDCQCVSLAAYQMKEDASDWWIELWARRPEAELHALTWEQMKVMVRSKFLPQSFWDRMEHEFYHLQQGSSSVDEYIRTFTRMCLFAGDAVNTDAKKARKFLKGLNQRIRELVGSHGPMSYADTVSRAQEVESCLIPVVPIPSYPLASQPPQTIQYAQPISTVPPDSSSGKRKSDFKNKGKGKKGNFGRRDDRPTQGQLPRCPKCGRFHTGECLADQRACYNCN